jgi:argininosuccinate lyase
MKNKVKAKAWAGRFEEGANLIMEEFTSSLAFDNRLVLYEIRC